MFSRSPYYSYYPSYDDYYGYQNPYARAQAEQQHRAQLLLERQREAERRRAAALEANRRQRASQYLPAASMMYPGTNRSYVPERASRYLPDEFDHYGPSDDDDDDAYDYGFGRAGSYPTVPMARERERRSSKAASKAASNHPQVQPRKAGQQRPKSRSRSRSRGQSWPPVSEPQTRKPSPQPSSAPPTAPVDNPVCSPSPSREKMEEAAVKIQSAYRIHRALRTVETLYRKFNELKSSFTLPSVHDFQILTPEHHVSLPPPSGALDALKAAGTDIQTLKRISMPKLAYTHANAPLHGYIESLNRLLTSLDGVESYGEKRVREKRKEAVRAVEAEARRIEDGWKRAWDDWISALSECCR